MLLELGQLQFPESPTKLQDQYFKGIDFDGLTRKEIEALLRQREWEQLSKKAKLEYEQKWHRKSALLPGIAEILEELLKWKEQMAGYEYARKEQGEEEEEFEL